MSRNKNYHRPNFFRSHADTLAIVGVNLAIAAILITMIISNVQSINAVNARADQLHSEFLQLIKEGKK
jgi:hypothetical protein